MQDNPLVRRFIAECEPPCEADLLNPEADLRRTLRAIRCCWRNAGLAARFVNTYSSTHPAAGVCLSEVRQEAMKVRLFAAQSTAELAYNYIFGEPMVYTVVLRDAYMGMVVCLTLLCIGEARGMVDQLAGVLYA